MTWVLHVVFFILEGCLLVFHISVAYVIIRQRAQNNRTFQNAFFTLYLVQSAFDLLSYSMGSLVLRLLRCKLLHIEWFDPPIIGKLTLFCIGFGVFFECFTHTAIAANRYTVITYGDEYKWIWRGKWLTLIIAVVFILSLSCAANRFSADVRIIVSADAYVLVNADPVTRAPIGAIAAGVLTLTSVTNLALELRTLVAYHRLSQHMKQERLDDFRLLIYAMLGLVAQSLLAAFFVSTIVTSNLVSSFIASLTQAIPYGVDLLSLGSPVCLFVTSQNLRRHYLESYRMCGRKDTSATQAPQQRTMLKLDDLRTISVN